jgi:hypothetical protein
MRATKIVASLSLVLLMTLLSAGLAFSQATDGNITGTVLDPTGAFIVGANIELQNVATGVKLETTSNADGLYRFNNIPVGIYKLTSKSTGFKTLVFQKVIVELNKTTTVKLNLELGEVTTEVEVLGATEMIDTTTAQITATYDSKAAEYMPTIESSQAGLYGVLNLSLLGAGVASNGGVGQGTGPSIGGQRPMNNNFSIEGVDNNLKTITGPLVYVPNDSVAQFSLLQNQFSSEFGHSSGGQFNTIIKGGTNELHGSAYEYFQNRNLNALDQAFFRQGIYDKPRYDQNRVGGAVGGPIVKNKLFYFGNFEYAPNGQASTAASPILSPTAEGYSLLSGMLGVSKTNLDVLKKYMAPSPSASSSTKVNGVTIPIGILPVVGPNFTNQYSWLVSVDYNVSEKDSIRGRYINNKVTQLDTDANLPAFWVDAPQKFHLFTASEYHTFSSTVTNEFRIGYNRFDQRVPVPEGLAYPGLDAFPNITIDNDLAANIGPDDSAPQSTIQNTYQLVENLSWTKGKHTFKFGGEYRKIISPQHFIQRERGDYFYSNLELFLLDQVPDELAQRNVGSTQYYGDQYAIYWFANDTYRIRPNFSLNLGLRYEYTSNPYTYRLQALNSVSDVPGVITFHEPTTQKKNFAPRIGIAYSPGSSGNTSIRAGFGINYDVIFDNVGSTSYPPQLSSTVDADPLSAGPFNRVPFLAQGGIPSNAKGSGSLTAAEARDATSSYIQDQVLPYSIQWNFGIQHVFKKDYTFEARYLGTRGVHLLVQNQINRVARISESRHLPTYLQAPSQAALDALPLTLANLTALSNNKWAQYGFNSTITSWPPIGNSTYHGMALQLTRRFSRGLSMIGAYTWSHNIDDSTATHFSTVLTPRREQDFQNLAPDKASSALDRRHRLTASGIWEIPWFSKDSSWFKKNLLGNFSFVASYTAESPEYATVQSGVDSNLNGDTAGDRTIINPGGDLNKGSAVTALKNTAGATVGYLANDPSARYITAGAGAYANGGRNTLRLIGINNFDMSIIKKFSISETKRFELRGEFFNAVNHPQFTPGYIGTVRLTQDTNTRAFLVPGSDQFNKLTEHFGSNPRSIQLVVRFIF